MGRGSYVASDWEKLKNARGIQASSKAEQIFVQTSFKDKYDPKYINMRESRDSEDSPNSTPIILAFDVTYSMGYLAEEIAKNSLNKTILELYDKQPIPNPHIMCAAITSPGMSGSLQVTQFEADIRIVEQLLELKVRFGGNKYSYDSLVWYFAAKHTSIDSYEKRGKKGFLFVIGDEICGAKQNEVLTAAEILKVFGDETAKGYPLRELYEAASEKYEIFHLGVGRKLTIDSWKEFIPGRAGYVERVDTLSEVITSIMQLTNGMSREAVLAQWPEDVRGDIGEAIKDIGCKRVRGGIVEQAKKLFRK